MSRYEGKIEDFLEEILRRGKKYLPQADHLILNKKINFIKVRFRIKADLFMDIYYNSYNGRKDYMLVGGGRRLFGYDNFFGWHCHPIGDPNRHISCAEPSSEKVFLMISKAASIF